MEHTDFNLSLFHFFLIFIITCLFIYFFLIFSLWILSWTCKWVYFYTKWMKKVQYKYILQFGKQGFACEWSIKLAKKVKWLKEFYTFFSISLAIIIITFYIFYFSGGYENFTRRNILIVWDCSEPKSKSKKKKISIFRYFIELNLYFSFRHLK